MGRAHATTRRTSGRRFLLKPTPEITAILRYCLGVALSRYPKVHLVALSAQATHIHGNLHDAAGPDELSQLSAFFREFHSLSARALNAHHGRGENLWCAGRWNNVELHDQPALEDQLLYTWTQSVKDGLVPRPELLPALQFFPEDFGQTFTVRKPKGAFFGGRRPAQKAQEALSAEAAMRKVLAAERAEAERELRDRKRRRSRKRRRHMAEDRRRRRRKRKERAPRPQRDRSTLPDEVTFQVHFPPGYEHLSPDEARAHFRRLLEERIVAIHEERRAEGRTRYMGVAAILDQSPTESSGSTFPDFARNPTIACKNKKRRVAALIDKKAWRARYSETRAKWKSGNRDVIFPAGSYGLPHLHGAAVERAPPVVL